MESFAPNRKHKPAQSWTLVLRTLEGLAAVALATFLLFYLRLNLAAAGFVYLLIILVLALRNGFWVATAASLLASSCLNYFFAPPLFQFTIDDPQNWIALFTFECTALIVSRLSLQAHQQARKAARSKRDLECLFQLSSQYLSLDDETSRSNQIASLIHNVFSATTVVLLDGRKNILSAAGEHDPQLDLEVRGAYLLGESLTSSDSPTVIRLLSSGKHPIGALAVRGGSVTKSTAEALSSLTAIALDQKNSFQPGYRSHEQRVRSRSLTSSPNRSTLSELL